MTDEARLATKSDADQTRWLTAERAFTVQAERQAPAASGVAILPKPLEAVQGKQPSVDLTRGVTVTLHGVERAAVAPALASLGVAEKRRATADDPGRCRRRDKARGLCARRQGVGHRDHRARRGGRQPRAALACAAGGV